jgi:cytochrome c
LGEVDRRCSDRQGPAAPANCDARGNNRHIVVFANLIASSAALADDAVIARGREIAIENCSRCHAVGTTAASVNPKSPFRTLAQKYPLENLEEALGEGITVGHEGLEMPHFQLDAGQIEALISYIASVQEK